MLAFIVSLMLFASCAMTSQQAADQPSQPSPDVPVKMREVIPLPAPNMGAKRDLGTYIRHGSQLLAKGNQEAARLELERGLYYYPKHDILTTLFKQIDADPKALFGDQFTSYTIQPGDTLSTIAQDKLGNSLLFYGLAKYNGIDKPQAINVGQLIKIPTALKPPKPLESKPRIAKTPLAPIPHSTQGLRAQEAPAEPGQAPKKPVRVAETTPEPMPAPKPEPPQGLSEIKAHPASSPDQLPPRIELTEPASLQQTKALKTTEEYLQLSGIVTDDSDVRTLLINDALIDLDAQGHFSHRIDLPAGRTALTLVAIDAHNRIATSTYTITRHVMPKIRPDRSLRFLAGLGHAPHERLVAPEHEAR
jgi:LysM repeat protein